MDTGRIAQLLRPFVRADLSSHQLDYISTYIDILLNWNQRLNLTAIRAPDEIIRRHFGESLLAAQHLFVQSSGEIHIVDVGSGAGFPGLPIKIWAPEITLTLIEANQKKAVFLREVARALHLTEVEVFGQRAENYPDGSADVVTMRAVEQFESVLPVAAKLLKPAGRIALLVGIDQVNRAHTLLPHYNWHPEIPVPVSKSRVFLVGQHP